LISSKLKVGGFQIPIDLDGDEEAFSAQAAQLPAVAEIARRVGAMTGTLAIPAATNRLPYPEYFEVIRKRINTIAETFGQEEVKVALTFNARSPQAADKEFKFIRDVEGFSVLVRACNSKHVGIVFDSWQWFLGKGTEAMLDQIGLERIAAVRLGDCREDVSPDDASADDCLLPGTTDCIDSVGYLRKFAEAGFKLPVSAEGRSLEAGTRDALIARTQDALDKTFEAAGLPSHTRRPESFVHTSSYAAH
jgi:sugar phosphate isomerase/epimerase